MSHTTVPRDERYSGHESFACRYGWFPKLYETVISDPASLDTDDTATQSLGIGRNMVRSIMFWGESAGVISLKGKDRVPGDVGKLLLDSKRGWDPFLEKRESIWLLHWVLCTRANLAAWNHVFGSRRLTYFTRNDLRDAVRDRARNTGKTLADSTVDQHVAIFLSTYLSIASSREEQNTDDALWSPFQDLGLVTQKGFDNGEIVYCAEQVSPLGLSARVYIRSLYEYWRANFPDQSVASLASLVSGQGSPGSVFRLTEEDTRGFLYQLQELTEGALSVQDTIDTQAATVNWAAPSVQKLIGAK